MELSVFVGVRDIAFGEMTFVPHGVITHITILVIIDHRLRMNALATRDWSFEDCHDLNSMKDEK